VKICIDRQFCEVLKEKLADYVNRTARTPDGKYHVSELLNPRFAYFQRIKGSPSYPDRAWMFLPGVAFHELLQKIMGRDFAEKQVGLEDIVGTVDMVGAMFSEIKTSRKYTIPIDPEPHYVEQFEKYLSIAGQLFGWIIVIYFVAGRKWDGSKPSKLEIVTWKVTMTAEEQEKVRQDLISRRDMLMAAEEEENHEQLPLCWEFMCASVYKGKVDEICPHYDECRPQGRYPLKFIIRASDEKYNTKQRAIEAKL